jgi:hypothetical protein
MTDAKARYVGTLLDRYRQLPGTLQRVLRDDRRTALSLYHRRVTVDVVDNAFVVALARRAFGANPDQLPAIRTLRYFLPVIQEVELQPPDPAYLDYLRHRLRDAGLYPPP